MWNAWGQESCIQGFGGETCWNGMGGGMDWVDVAQDKDSGERLCMRQRTFGFHKLQEISWLAENRLASEEALCSIELVIKK